MIRCEKCNKYFAWPAYNYRWVVIETHGDGGRTMKRGDVLYPVCPYCLEELEHE
jgi:hypothetical protein